MKYITALVMVLTLSLFVGCGEEKASSFDQIVKTHTNEGPVPTFSQFTLAEDVNFSSTLTASDADQDTLTFSLESTSTHGVLSLSSGGDLNYTPNSNYYGDDSFTYAVSDGKNSVTQVVSITITAVNDAPTFSDTDISMLEDGTYTFTAHDIDSNTLTYTATTSPSFGSLAYTVNGALTYTPNANYNGNDAFILSIKDEQDSSADFNITLTIAPVADTIYALTTSLTTSEDVALTTVLEVSNVDSISISFEVPTQPTHGTISIDSNGSMTYTPTANYFGTDTFTYRVNNLTASTFITQSVTVTVASVNDIPVPATDNNFSIDEDDNSSTARRLNVSDAENDTLNFTLNQAPSNGNLILESNGSFTYVPYPNFNGSDSFSYNVDDNLSTIVQSVGITVRSVNDAPTAITTAFSTSEDVQRSVFLQANDLDQDTLTFTIETNASKGSTTLDTNGTLLYTPNANFFGEDNLTYRVSDGNVTVSQLLSITVSAVNDSPIAHDTNFTIDEDNNVTFDLNVSDVDGDALTFTLKEAPVRGAYSFSSDGNLTYEPNANFEGNDTFTFHADDGNVTIEQSITIHITAVNDAPVPITKSFGVAFNSSRKNVLFATDIDDTNLTFSLIKGSDTNSTVYIDANGSYEYNNTYVSGEYNDTITYRVSDGNLSVDQNITVYIGVLNNIPIPTTTAFSVNEDTQIKIDLEANDSDATDTLLYYISTPPTTLSATFSLDINGTLTYKAGNDQFGTDSLKYIVYDGKDFSEKQYVTITVNAVNDAPVAQTSSVSTNEDTTLSTRLTAIDVDNASSAFNFAIASSPTKGSATLDSNGTLHYTPSVNYNGTDSLTYTVNDGNLTSAAKSLSISIAPVNDAPVATTTSFIATEDVTYSGTLSGSDVDGNSLTYYVYSNPAHASQFSLLSNGSITYKAATNYNGTDSFSYRVYDGQYYSDVQTVTITVNAVNDAPTASSPSFSSFYEDTNNNGTLVGYANDIDGNTLYYYKYSDPSHGSVTVNTNGTFSYTPVANYIGSDSFTFRVYDGQYYSNIATVSITVLNADNDTPIPTYSSASTNEDTTLYDTLTATELDGQSVTFTKTVSPTHGSLTVYSSGYFIYTPYSDYHGPDSFTYSASDGSLSATKVVNLTVNSVNDPITANDIEMPYCYKDGLNVITNWKRDSRVSDVDLIQATATVTTNGSYGFFRVQGDMISYSATDDAATRALPYADKAVLTLSDNAGSTASITVTITQGCNEAVAGTYNSFVIKRDQTLWGWGDNSDYQLGIGTTTNATAPIQISGSSWKQISAGSVHTLAIQQDGDLYAWGTNADGQLGNGTLDTKTYPTYIDGSVWKKINTHGYTSYGIKEDGTLWAWGRSSSGQVGNGSTADQTSPIQIGSATNWVDVQAGYYHVLALNKAGELYAWGGNSDGQLGIGSTTNASTPQKVGTKTWRTIAAGYMHSLAIDSNGWLYTWGNNAGGQLGTNDLINRTVPTLISTATDWVLIDGGGYFSTAIKRNNAIYHSGSNNYGQIGNAVAYGGSVKVFTSATGSYMSSLSSGYWHNTFTQYDNDFWNIGNNAQGQLGNGTTTSTDAWQNVSAVADSQLPYWEQLDGGWYHTVGVRKNGTLWTWGWNYYGQLGDGTTVEKTTPVQIQPTIVWVKAKANGYFSAGLSHYGYLYVWGHNAYGQIGNGTTTNQTTPDYLTYNVKDFALGYGHLIFQSTNNSLLAVGYNLYGQLGDGTTTDKTNFITIDSSGTLAKIEAGYYSTYGIRFDGTLYSWGYNGYGQLGIGSYTSKSAPTKVDNSEMWQGISSKGYSAYALNEGDLYDWGYNAYGQLGDGTTTNKTTPTYVTYYYDLPSSGMYHMATTVDNSSYLRVSGQNTSGQLGNGTTTNSSTILSIYRPTSELFTGLLHNFALFEGRLYGWGDNGHGQLGNGATTDLLTPTYLGW